jgi:hypothetical protein
MATNKASTSNNKSITKAKTKRPKQHKKKASSLKSSKNYRKKNVGQGR